MTATIHPIVSQLCGSVNHMTYSPSNSNSHTNFAHSPRLNLAQTLERNPGPAILAPTTVFSSAWVLLLSDGVISPSQVTLIFSLTIL